MHDIVPMFEGTLRTVQELHGGWWMAWFLLALSWGLFQRIQPNHRQWMQWAWTDHRLLVLELGDRQRMPASWVVANLLSGVALSMAVAGMMTVSNASTPSFSLVLRLFLIWSLLMGLRWMVSMLWNLHAGDAHVGEVFLLNHRVLMESTAWVVAPIGFVCSCWGPDASRVGIWIAAAIWTLGWILRQTRGFAQSTRFRKQPLLGMLYLCGLEILPVAVLIRTWQG